MRWWCLEQSGIRLARLVRAAVAPFCEVVDVAVAEADGAVGCGAGLVHGAKCSALIGAGEAFGSSDVDDSAFAVQHDRDDVGLAGQASHRGWWEGLSVVGLAHAVVVEAGAEGVEVDEHEQFGRAAGARCDRRGDHRHERVGPDLIEAASVIGFGLLGGDGGVERG